MKAPRTKKLTTLFVVLLAFGLSAFTVFAEEKNIDQALPDCKILLGEIEKLNLVKFDATLGSHRYWSYLSSIHARNIQIYRRNTRSMVQLKQKRITKQSLWTPTSEIRWHQTTSEHRRSAQTGCPNGYQNRPISSGVLRILSVIGNI